MSLQGAFFNESQHLAVSQLFIINRNNEKYVSKDIKKHNIFENLINTNESYLLEDKFEYDPQNYYKNKKQISDGLLSYLGTFFYRGSTPKY